MYYLDGLRPEPHAGRSWGPIALHAAPAGRPFSRALASVLRSLLVFRPQNCLAARDSGAGAASLDSTSHSPDTPGLAACAGKVYTL
jgi:hypothetical protein